MVACWFRNTLNTGFVLLFAMQAHLVHAAECVRKDSVAQIVSLQGTVTIDDGPARLNSLLCPDNLLVVGDNSGASILLFETETTIRIDQKSHLRVPSPPKAKHSVLDILRGAVYLFSRNPRALDVNTPYANALIEGTEFLVSVKSKQTIISVFEGRVVAKNNYGDLDVPSGKSVVAVQGKRPEFSRFIRPENAVQWALHYRPVLYALFSPEEISQISGKSISTASYADAATLIDQLQRVPTTEQNESYFVLRASLLLVAGRADAAKQDIVKALEVDNTNGEALALSAIISVTQNESPQALEFAAKAVALDPQSIAGWLALSYAQQSMFDLDKALESVETAVELDPDNALALSRLSELLLSHGELEKAQRIAERAVTADPDLARSQTVSGFTNLSLIKLDLAKRQFSTAIELDSTDPLPRLGLGLAKIRQGHLASGREDFAIAVSLDPLNSLYRSYLGKTYFEEKRGSLAEAQYDIAKQLDPNDPTPWFYDAIRLQLGNRSVEALDAIEKSIDLNDNRAVYRSRLLLDEDQAARGASLARIYSDLGFDQLGINEAIQALNTDPTNSAAHRLLADLYVGKPRLEVARVSELLQAQLLQPVGLNPIQPSLAFTDLNLVARSGPAEASFNEFNSMYFQDGLRLDATGAAGTDSTWGEEIAVSGLYGRSAFSIGQYHYETDGFRENNDLEHDIYTVFGQTDFNSKFSLQGEYRNRESGGGDRKFSFDPDVFSREFRTNQEEEVVRIGGRSSLSASRTVLFSMIYSDRTTAELSDDISFGESEQAFDTILKQYEAQYIDTVGQFELIGGIGLAASDSSISVNSEGLSLPSLDIESDAVNLYIIGDVPVADSLELSSRIGYSKVERYRELQGNRGEDIMDGFTPAVGLTWRPGNQFRLSAATGRTIKRPFVTNQTIQPTHHSGFNEQFDDLDTTRADWLGISSTYFPSSIVRVGSEIISRKLARNSSDNSSEKKTRERDTLFNAFLNWTVSNRIAVSTGLSVEDFSANESDTPTVLEMQIFTLPLQFAYVAPGGWFANASASLLKQSVLQFGNVKRESNEVFVDLALGYRFTSVRGMAAIRIDNLFDQELFFQDQRFRTSDGGVSGPNPRFAPSRRLLATFSINF